MMFRRYRREFDAGTQVADRENMPVPVSRDRAISAMADTRKGDPMNDKLIKRFAHRVGYSEAELKTFYDGGHRIRQVEKMAPAARRYTIEAAVVKARHCNSGYKPGDTFVLDIDGNFISGLCPKRLCVYLVSQFAVPVALINERISEGLDPNPFHFMRHVKCLDAGVECMGYGETMVKIQVVNRTR